MEKIWIKRLEEDFFSYEDEISRKYLDRLKKHKKLSLETVLINAEKNKSYDIYHSTTIEGYQITEKEVEGVLLGKIPLKGPESESLKNRLAILGHSVAFDFVIKAIKNKFNNIKIEEEMVLDIYSQLFKPSADAGIIDKFALAGYRKVPVYIRGSRFVPPAYEKLADLMATFVKQMKGIKHPIIKAILGHYFLVTIHPFIDGNGRCARLLMNYILAGNGYKWITISANEREKYFESLKIGQLENNILPFADFILSF